MKTPALVIDEKVVFYGKVLPSKSLKYISLMEQAMNKLATAAIITVLLAFTWMNLFAQDKNVKIDVLYFHATIRCQDA